MRLKLVDAVLVRTKGAGKDTPLAHHEPGDVIEVDFAVGIDLLRSGRALALPDEPEAAVKKTPEKAVKKTAKAPTPDPSSKGRGEKAK